MREIKFRAWNKSKKEFVYTNPYDGYVICKNKMCSNDYGDLCGDDNFEAPEQFTGLLDKNGKEIYEGDYISVSNIRENKVENGFLHFEVFFEYGSFQFAWSDGNDTFGGDFTLKDFDVDSIEVIGNIHEEPKE